MICDFCSKTMKHDPWVGFDVWRCFHCEKENNLELVQKSTRKGVERFAWRFDTEKFSISVSLPGKFQTRVRSLNGKIFLQFEELLDITPSTVKKRLSTILNFQ